MVFARVFASISLRVNSAGEIESGGEKSSTMESQTAGLYAHWQDDLWKWLHRRTRSDSARHWSILLERSRWSLIYNSRRRSSWRSLLRFPGLMTEENDSKRSKKHNKSSVFAAAFAGSVSTSRDYETIPKSQRFVGKQKWFSFSPIFASDIDVTIYVR